MGLFFEKFEDLIYEGLGYYQAGNFEKAIMKLHKAIKKNNKSPDPHDFLGNVYFDMNRMDDAAKEFKQADSLGAGQFYQCYFNAGVTFLKRKSLKEAIKNFRKAQLIRETSTSVKNYLAHLFQADGQIAEAIMEYEALLEISPNNIEALFNLGYLYSDQEISEKAIEVFEKLLIISRNDPRVMNNLGILYMKLGNFKMASDYFIKALSHIKGVVYFHKIYIFIPFCTI